MAGWRKPAGRGPVTVGGSGMLAVIFLSVCVRGMGRVSRAREM